MSPDTESRDLNPPGPVLRGDPDTSVNKREKNRPSPTSVITVVNRITSVTRGTLGPT